MPLVVIRNFCLASDESRAKPARGDYNFAKLGDRDTFFFVRWDRSSWVSAFSKSLGWVASGLELKWASLTWACQPVQNTRLMTSIGDIADSLNKVHEKEELILRETVSLPFQYLCVLILITSVLTKTPTLQCVLKDLGGECSFCTVCRHQQWTSVLKIV